MGVISKHLKGLAGNVVGGMVGSLLNGGFNPQTGGTVSAIKVETKQKSEKNHKKSLKKTNTHSVQYNTH